MIKAWHLSEVINTYEQGETIVIISKGCEKSEKISRKYLSEAEFSRSSVLINDEHKSAYRYRHIILQCLINLFEGGKFIPQIFSIGKYGKPFLKTSNVCFNISSSGLYHFLAFAKNCKVGIDAEQMSEIKSLDSNFIDAFLTLEEIQLFNVIPSEKMNLAVTQAWIVKEAVLKCIGTGFILEPRNHKILSQWHEESNGWIISTNLIPSIKYNYYQYSENLYSIVVNDKRKSRFCYFELCNEDYLFLLNYIV